MNNEPKKPFDPGQVRSAPLEMLGRAWTRHGANILLALVLFAASNLFVEIFARLSAKEFGAEYSQVASACWWDCGWYSSIVDEGYHLAPKAHPKGDAANWAFFPAFPVAAKAFGLVTGARAPTALVLTSKLFFLLSLFAFITLVSVELGREYRLPAGLTLAFGPYVIYAHAGYTETLYFLASTLAFLSLRNGRWIAAGAVGGILSATRPVGFLFVISYLIEGGRRNLRDPSYRRTDMVLGLMLVPIGLALFMVYLYFLVGDALAFKHVQVAWGRSVGSPFDILKQGIVHGGWERYFACIAVAGLAMSIWHLVRRRTAYAVFLAGVILLPLTSGLAGMPRYLFWQMPFLFGIVEVFGARRFLFALYLTLSAAFSSFVIVSWFTGKTFLI